MRYSKDEMEKILLITHKDCPDGCGCAVVFRAAGGLKENVAYVSAGKGVGQFFKKNVDYLKSFDRILVADVAPDLESAEKIEKEYDHVTVIDHHKTALDLKDKDWCMINMEKCGTYLLFDYLFDEFDSAEPTIGEGPMKKAALHNFAVLTNDRDMWLRQYKKANEMSMLMDFLGRDRYVERALVDYFAFEWNGHEKELLDILAEKKEKYIEAKIQRTIIIETDDKKKLGYLFVSQHQSDVLNRMLETHDIDAAIGIKLDGGGVISVRSGENFDASAFCLTHGGGGHAKSAGHSIDNETLKEILEVIHP